MSNLISFDDLKKEFLQKTKVKDLKEFAKSQQDIIEFLMNENKTLKEKISKLETLQANLTPEELICIEQINILKSVSKHRELSLDEVKRLDLLVKNLRLIREKSTENVATPKTRDVTEADLVAIVSEISTEN